MESEKPKHKLIRITFTRITRETLAAYLSGRKNPGDPDIIAIVRGTMIGILLKEQTLAGEWARCGKQPDFYQISGRAAKTPRRKHDDNEWLRLA